MSRCCDGINSDELRRVELTVSWRVVSMQWCSAQSDADAAWYTVNVLLLTYLGRQIIARVALKLYCTLIAAISARRSTSRHFAMQLTA